MAALCGSSVRTVPAKLFSGDDGVSVITPFTAFQVLHDLTYQTEKYQSSAEASISDR